MSKQNQRRPAQRLIEKFTWVLHWLKTGNPAATIDRFFESQHVHDLRFIVGITLGLFVIIAACLLLGSPYETDSSRAQIVVINTSGQVAGTPGSYSTGGTTTTPDHGVLKVVVAFFTGLTTVVAVAGAICAWAYKTGSARLGVVDLFACEISALCRVTLVTDFINHCKYRIEEERKATRESAAAPHHELPRSHEQASSDPVVFTSNENYFPVFEGNTRDLQSLEARVVINITSFYTYMKTARDLMRSAAALKPGPIRYRSRKSRAAKTRHPAQCHAEHNLHAISRPRGWEGLDL